MSVDESFEDTIEDGYDYDFRRHQIEHWLSYMLDYDSKELYDEIYANQKRKGLDTMLKESVKRRVTITVKVEDV